MNSILEALHNHASHIGGDTAFTFLEDGETKENKITFFQLYKGSEMVAEALSKENMCGERVVLIFDTSPLFLFAFFGCLMASAIAVPMSSPKKSKKDYRLRNVIEDSKPNWVMTSHSLVEGISNNLEGVDTEVDLKIVAIEGIVGSIDSLAIQGAVPHMPLTSVDAVAFLQYTSGSTGNPKGVIVSHNNIVRNQEMIKDAFQHTDNTIFGGWLPLFHDMGLIGNILQPIFLGIHAVLMPPMQFIQKPIRWLDMINRYGVTTSGGPNFAYNLCVKKIREEDLQGIDLSSWEVAFNGAERVSKETITAFTKKFKPVGFRASAMFPCYGMAEATLFVAGERVNGGVQYLTIDKAALEDNQIKTLDSSEASLGQGTDVVSCGSPWRDEEIIIANENTLEKLPSGVLGEIWVRGPNIVDGYWNNSVETASVFNAIPSEGEVKEANDLTYFRTGDLGFLDTSGRLYVTGRIKEMIILNGRNFYPDDIERTVRNVGPVFSGCIGAAFSTKGGAEENLVIVQEVNKKFIGDLNQEEIVNLVVGEVIRDYGIRPSGVALVYPGSVPRTSSGKIQRLLCREMYKLNRFKKIE